MQTGYPFSFSVRIVGTKASVEYSYSAGATIADRSASKSELKVWRRDKGLDTCEVSDYDAYEKQMRYFLSCVERGVQPDIITPDESYEVIKMIDALHRSADTGEIILMD